MGHRAHLMVAAIPRRALLLLITFLAMWMGATGTATAHAAHPEAGTGRADAATTVARHVYDVGLQHARTLQASATSSAAGNAGRDRERTHPSGGCDFPVASRSAAEATVVETERTAAIALKPGEATARWDEFLGEGPTTNIHPRTGLPDADRIVSADGTRSIRFGDHEMGSSATKFHFHEETWSFDPGANTWYVDNLMVRVPFPKGTW